MKYSTRFLKETIGQISLKKLIKDNNVDNEGSDISTLDTWEQMRHFISLTINKSGTFLDLGCANGFLLKCLQEWSNHDIVPYGVDFRPEYISDAKNIFPMHTNNFKTDLIKSGSTLPQNFPEKFDFIYWATWLNLDSNKYQYFIKSLKNLVKPRGRLIIGFYDWNNEKTYGRIDRLKKLGIEFDGIIENPLNTEFLIWIDNK